MLCDPTDPLVPGRVLSYQRSADPVKSGATANPNSLIWSLPASSINPWDGVVPGGSPTYWKCSGASVVEMSQAEKDAVDAPALVEAQRQAAFETEIVSNTFCDGALVDVKAAVDAQIDSWVTARQAEINATTNFATLKAALRDQTIPAIGNAMKTGLKKIVGCVRARAR